MEEQFKPGDVVRLHSGGPAMTVCAVVDVASRDGVSTLKHLRCVWYAGEAAGYSTSFFDPECVYKVRT